MGEAGGVADIPSEEGRALVARALADVEATDAVYFAALEDRREGFLNALSELAGTAAHTEGG